MKSGGWARFVIHPLQLNLKCASFMLLTSTEAAQERTLSKSSRSCRGGSAHRSGDLLPYARLND
eukprot:1169625-Amphidinium_carterae.1